MKYKLLGRSGLRVSELALGTMTLSEDDPWGWGVGADTSREILEAYADAGGNFIDTACNYTDGQSERVIGDFIAGDRDRYVVATKFTLHHHEHPDDPNFGGNHRKNLRRTLEASLDRLGTDYIDLLYLHVWDYTTPLEEVISTLNHVVESGLVHHVGISDSPAWVAAQANQLADHHGWERFVACQFPYNIGRRSPEREVMPYCRYNDVGMTTWSVLGAGLYTGKYTTGDDDPSGRIAGGDFNDADLAIARCIDDIADELGVPSTQVTLAWTQARDRQLFPIVGATDPDHVTEAVGATDVDLDDAQLERLDEVASYDTEFPQSFTGSENVLELIHGETADRLENHRFRGY
jgi:aryl-alcohol dehydrogenase-like predicted oxidoreductase